MIKAAIDIGTNSVRLLVAQFDKTAGLKILEQELVTTRLGQSTGQSGYLGEAGIERTFEALREFKIILQRYPVEGLKVAATSAVRDALNKDVFINKVNFELGWRIDVLSGKEEARLSYLGVTKTLSLIENSLVIDVGGGSTEFIWIFDDQVQTASVNAGAVRMTDLCSDRIQIREVLLPVLTVLNKVKPSEVIGVGGTVTTLAAVDLGLVRYDPQRVHGYELTSKGIKEILQELSSKTLEERRMVPGLQPQRADIIIAGIIIVDIILTELNLSRLVASEADLLTGMIYDLL